MSDLARLGIWDDPAIRDGLSWYLAVAENRRLAKFLIAGLIVILSREVRGRSLSAGFARADGKSQEPRPRPASNHGGAKAFRPRTAHCPLVG